MKNYPVSAIKTQEGWTTPGLDFGDYSRMSTQQRKQSGERRLATPKWAVNNEMLQELLVAFMEERAGFRKKQKGTLLVRLERAKAAIINQRPNKIAILDRLCAQYVNLKRFGFKPDISDEEARFMAEDVFGRAFMFASDPDTRLGAREVLTDNKCRDWEIEIEGLDTYLRVHETGGAATIASIVYLYYRVGLDSVGVGAELGLKPPHVRQTLWRLFETAAKLWPDSVPVAAKESGKKSAVADHIPMW